MKYLIFVLTLLMVGCAGQDSFIKEGTSDRASVADMQSCQQLAEMSGFPRNAPYIEASGRRNFLRECMYSKGYDRVNN